MSEGRLNPEKNLAGAQESEAEMAALFARMLPEEPLPPDLVARTQRIVLSEVRRTIQPAARAQHPPAATWSERLRRWWRSLSPAQSLAMYGAVGALALLCLVGLTRLTPQTQTATVAIHEGAALVLRDETNSFRTFYAGDILKVDTGDHIITAQSSALLQPFDAQQAIVAAGTHLEILNLQEDFGNTQVEYRVHRGALHSIIDETLEASDRYVVQSPLVTVTATGTEFTVETVTEEETRVTVISGVVTVQMGDEEVTVAAGQTLRAVAGAPLKILSGDDVALGAEALVVADLDNTPLTVRSAPSVAAPAIGSLAASALLRIEGRDNSGRWLRVCCIDGASGWVNLTELGDDSFSAGSVLPAGAVPVAPASPSASPPAP